MKICTNCGSKNQDQARFCQVCGTALGYANVCLNCGAPNRDGAKFCVRCRASLSGLANDTVNAACPGCGAPCEASAKFCKVCGTPLTQNPAGASTTRCSKCGTANKSGAKFCKGCGESLTKTMPAPSETACPHCGTINRDGAKFCRQCRAALAAPPPPLPKPAEGHAGNLLPMTKLRGRYLIVQHIASGGMSHIYEARDQKTNDQTIAIKEMNESQIALDERESVMEAFRQEAKILRGLSHKNLLKVWDLFKENGRLYMSMELLEGQTLGEILDQASKPLPEDQVLEWADQLCDVLSYLHNQPRKIIYRDIKPGNVMALSDDTVKLIDFGIARFYKPGKRKDTIAFGTDGYAPPEQYGKQQTDERADVYALGALLHHLLTLRDPKTELFKFPPLRSLNNKVCERVESAIQKATEVEREDRFESIKDMRAALLGKSHQRTKASSLSKAPPKKKKTASSKQAQGIVAPLTRVKASPRQLTLKSADGKRAQGQITVHLGGQKSARVMTSAGWLSVSPKQVKTDGEKVTAMLHPERVPMHKLEMDVPRAQDGPWSMLVYCATQWAAAHARHIVPDETKVNAQVIIAPGNDKVDIDITAIVSPTKGQIKLGWFNVAFVMLAEIGLVLALIVIIMASS